MSGLVSLAAVEAYLDIGSDSGGPIDTAMNELITDMADLFDRLTNRYLRKATYTHQMDGKGEHVLISRQFPVTTLTSVKLDPDWVFGAGALLPGGQVFVDQLGLLVNHVTWTQGIRNYQIVYTAGYDPGLPVGDPGAVPGDLRRATYLAVEFYYRLRSSDRIGIQSKTKIGENVTYTTDLPDYIMSMVMNQSRDKFVADMIKAGG